MPMTARSHVRVTFCGLFVILISVLSGCEARTPESTNSNSAPVQEIDEFEAEITGLKNADFDYIYAFKRKDGMPMDSEDKLFVKNNSHFATNRFTLTRDERVIFAGSNYKFEPAGLEALKDRFDFEDFSKPEAVLEKKRLEREATNDRRKNSNNSAVDEK